MGIFRRNIFSTLQFALIICLLMGAAANADFDRRLNYQGRLVDSNGVPVADNPTASIEFDICTNGSSTANCNSSTIWTETNTVPIVDGLFSSILGETNSIDGINFNSSEYYIQVTYGGNTYTPPQRITAAAMALNVPDGIITSAKMQDGAALDEISDNDGAGSGLDCDLLDGYDWSNVPGATDIWVNESGDTMSGDLNMGTDGSGKRIIFAATDASNEGGEFVLNGSGANTDWTVDNYAGRLRMHTGGSTYFDLNTSRLTLTGDLYVSGSDIYLPDANTHLLEGAGNSLRVQTADGYVEIGPQNGSYSHFITDLSQFYFNKQIVIAGHDIPYADDTYDLGTNSLKWRNLYIDGTAYLDDISCTDCLNETEIEDIYVLNSGDTMTGNLAIEYAGNPGIELRATAGGTSYIDWSNDGTSDYDARLRLTGNDLLYLEGSNLNIYTGYGIYFRGSSMGDDASRLYPSVNRLLVRAEDTDNVAQFAEYGLYLPSPLDSTYNLYVGDGMQVAYTESSSIDYRYGGNITTNTGGYTPIAFTNTSGYAHFGSGYGITMGDKPIYLRGSFGSDANHGFIYSSTVDGPEFRGYQGFIWKTGATGATERMRLTDDPVLTTGALALNKFHTVVGPGTGSDNQYHTVQCNSGYAISEFSVYSTNYWDGNVTLFCSYLGDLITPGSATWEDSTLETCDDCWHYATCSSGRVAIGWRAYANSRIDYNMQLLCAPLTTAGSTSMSNWMSTQNDEQSDDNMHGLACPAGTYLYSMAVYVNSYLDGDGRLRCRAPVY